MSDSRNIRLSGADQPPLVQAKFARPRRRRRGPIERGILDRDRNADRLMHELSNLLDGSLRNVGLAIGRLDAEPGDDAAIDQLRTADHALRHMADLLKAWRRDAHDPAIGAAMARANQTLGQAIRDAVRFTRPTCDTAAITLDARVDDAAIDQPLGPLYPVIVNGLRNAVEAIVAGGSIELTAERAGDQIDIRIADTGPGVARHLSRDRDGLVAAGASTKGVGRGLGLAISRDVVRALGGVIRLESRDDGLTGTVLRIRVPAADAPRRDPTELER